MRRAPALAAGLALAACCLAGAAARLGPAAAAASPGSSWAGYAVAASGTRYTRASATWVQPAVRCDAARAGSEATFWVGLGGAAPRSRALEQVGTEAACTQRGAPRYLAWYELVPSAEVALRLRIEPGDTISASLEAAGGRIELVLADRTRGTSAERRLRDPAADLSSAEWVVEAPSMCAGRRCHPEPLADFGSVGFGGVEAVGNGRAGTITDPSWRADPLELVPREGLRSLPPPSAFTNPGSPAGAAPESLAEGGGAFRVAWVADAAAVDRPAA